tara:strand:+ start:389 stop:547 length:159 start_codon:yes stop_codon:yes gene_type:complete
MINLYRIKYKSGKTDFFLATEEDKIQEEKRLRKLGVISNFKKVNYLKKRIFI